MQGIYDSETFGTKAAAEAWVRERETEILDGRHGNSRKTVAQALDRYADEVSTTKAGQRWEVYRLRAWKAQEWARKRVTDLTEGDIAKWRDERLLYVSKGTVRRELGLLASVLSVARKEWGWINRSPLVARPDNPRPRKRRVSWREARRILRALGFPHAEGKSREVGLAFLLALRTGMRSGEILALEKRHIDLKRRVIHVEQSKNGDERWVPMSRHAMRVVSSLGDPPFTVSDGSRDTLFRRAVDKAGIEDLHFHDTRREALSRLAKFYSPMELAKISGHRDLRILLNTYYSVDPEELASRLHRR